MNKDPISVFSEYDIVAPVGGGPLMVVRSTTRKRAKDGTMREEVTAVWRDIHNAQHGQKFDANELRHIPSDSCRAVRAQHVSRFQTGAVVTLNSGGVRMTVQDTSLNGDVYLFWSDGKALHEAELLESMLTAFLPADDEVPF